MSKILSEDTIKKRRDFLKTITTDSTRRAFELIFNKVKPFEEDIEKTIEDMNYEELLELLNNVLVGKSVESTNVKLSNVRKYLKFTGNKEILKLNKDDVKRAVENMSKGNELDIRYISDKELNKAMNRLDNDIDRAIIMLIHNGVYGNMITELQNLKVKDIDLESGTITLPNRKVKLNERDTEILREGMTQVEYYQVAKSNGTESAIESFHFNMESEYLIKTKPTKRTDDGLSQYKFSGITNRVFRVVGQLGLDIMACNILLSYAFDEVMKYKEEIGKTELLTISEIRSFIKNVLKVSIAPYDIYEMQKKYYENK